MENFFERVKSCKWWVHSSKVPLSQHQLLALHVSVGLVASSAGTITGKSYYVGDEGETREKERNLRLYMLVVWKLPCVY